MEKVKSILEKSVRLHEDILSDEKISKTIGIVSQRLVDIFKNKNRVLLCGNGGSAADAQHIAAELSGRLYFDRPPLPAEALHTNTSYLTAISNDYSFEQVFSRLISANGSKGDALIAISTSGNSPNIISALKTAREMGLVTIGLTGSSASKMKDLCDHIIQVPSSDTPRIQEAHILIGHIICEIVESSLFKNAR